MSDSILITTKKALGLDEEDDAFDTDLLMFINATLSDMSQLGVGPDEGFMITGPDELWSDFLGEGPRMNSAKLYVHISTRLVFDPPDPNVIPSYERLRDEMATRLTWKNNEVPKPTPDDLPEEVPK